MKKMLLGSLLLFGLASLVAGVTVYRDPTWLLPPEEREVIRGTTEKIKSRRADFVNMDTAEYKKSPKGEKLICGSFKGKNARIWFMIGENPKEDYDFNFSDLEHFYLTIWKDFCPNEPPPELREARRQWAASKTFDQIKAKLNDPDSAIFRNIKFFNEEENIGVCGELNAKNKFGGFAGYKRFVTESPSSDFSLHFDEGWRFDEVWKKNCS